MEVGDATPGLRINLFGQFSLLISGQALPETDIKGRKARSLLKLIALQRRGRIVRDQAMDTLWPDLDASAAASQLYKALHHIRKAFAHEADDAAEWIKMTDDLIRLAPPGGFVTDVHQFEQTARIGLRDRRISDLESAVSIYAGDLLPMDLYAEWTALPREHYRQLYIDVLSLLAMCYEQRGELSEAAQMLRLALEKDPALESAHRALMRIFARRGQPTRAFRQYDLCRDVLHSELGMGPSPETKETLDHVRERRLSKEAEPGTLRATTPSPMTPMINRAAECAEIERSLDRLSAGEGSTLIICGGVGLGKTRLIQELALRSRRRDLRVFSGGAQEGNGTVAYGPFVELFDAVLHDQPELQEALPVELGRLVPGFSGDGIPIPHADRLAAQGYLFAEVHRCLGRLADEGSVVIILEDLHAADEGSRELFAYLVRHGQELPILFAATTREEETAPLLARGAMARESIVTRLDLAPLTEDEHAALLRRHASAAGVSTNTAESIYCLSEGNPLFAIELLRVEADDGSLPRFGDEAPVRRGTLASSPGHLPPSLRHVVEQGLEGLSPSAHRLLYVAAAIGRHVPYELMAAVWSDVASTDEETMFEPLEEVLRARLLDEHGLDYSFRHVLVREVIYASISEARRRALHARVARQLVASSEEVEDEPVEDIAHHFMQAGRLRQAVHYLVRAGERAEAAYAHDDALQRFREALAALDELDDTQARRLRRDVLERIGDVYRACGRLERGYDAYEQAVALAEALPLSEPNRVELHRKIALVAIFRTEMDRSEHHLGRASDLVGEEPRPRARLLVTRALHLWHLNRLEEAYHLAHEALDIAEAADASAEASQACEILAMTCLPLGRWEEGLEYETRRHVYGWSPDIVVATDAHLCLWEYHVAGDQPFQRARSFIEGVAEQATELGDLRCVAVCHYALGTMHLWRGQDQQAVEELDASLDLHEEVGSPAGMAYSLARRGVLHTMQGATDLGWRAVQDGIAHAERAAVRDHCLQRLYGVGLWNRLEAGDLANARTLVGKSTALIEEAGACGACALELYPWLAYYYLRSGEIARARECGDAVSQLAATTGNPIGEAIAAMIESSLCAFQQDHEGARQQCDKAFERARGTVTEATHSPVVHYLDRMVDQQAALH